MRYLESKPYIYNKYFFPHDMRVTEWAGPKFTRVEKARQLGIKATIVDEVGLEDGIEYVRSAFGKIWIDEKKCAQLIKCLENYHREYDPSSRSTRKIPLTTGHLTGPTVSGTCVYRCLNVLMEHRQKILKEDSKRLHLGVHHCQIHSVNQQHFKGRI